MIDIAGAMDMSRVERNEALYRENEKGERRGNGRMIAGRVLSVIGTLMMVIVVAACLTLVIPKIAGYEAYVVVSGSMEPAIPVGSIVYSEKTDPSQLRVGDVIVFVDPSRGTTPITHRVVSNDQAAESIITKGDANPSEDMNPVAYQNVVGKVKTHIPRVGFTAAMFTSTLGKIIAAMILLEAWLLTEVGRRLRRKPARVDKMESC